LIPVAGRSAGQIVHLVKRLGFDGKVYRRACEIRLRAERKAGQLLTKMKANGVQWQKLGAMSQREFDLAVGTETLPSRV
jgi:hypothetical protein